MKHFLYILMAVLSVATCGKKPIEDSGTQSGSLDSPDGVKCEASTESSLGFSWSSVKNADSYAFRLKKGATLAKSGETVNAAAVIEGLDSETEYSFEVKAVNSKTSSKYSSPVKASTLKKEDSGSGTDPGTDPEPGTDPTPDPEPESDVYAAMKIPACDENDEVRAFPGAQGGGRFATGGRGGKIIHVTNLNDSGSGSLRAAVEASGARTVVFDVSGVIELSKKLQINNGDITIAGQTAPGDGICLKNYTFRINASNVIIRFIRCRMGDEKQTEDDAMNIMSHNTDFHDIIIDHCSLSWCTDECGSFYGMKDFTLQWCMLTESLRNSVHGKGSHGYGGIWGGSNACYHHNLLAHHDSRNPRFDHDYVNPAKGPVDYVNNVVYNWGGNSTYGGEGANSNNDFKMYNMVNNYYKPGPSTAAAKYRFLDPTTSCSNCTNAMGCTTVVPGHFYLNGNVMHGQQAMTDDNWTGVYNYTKVMDTIKSDKVFTNTDGKACELTIHSAADAFGKVLDYAGASYARDRIDSRIAEETRKGTYTYTGSNGSTNGFIDTQSDVGGWPAYSSTAEQLALVKDSDGDGIPDYYEKTLGLDPANAADGAAKTVDKRGRYTNLEMYFHYLVRDIVAGQCADGTYSRIQ